MLRKIIRTGIHQCEGTGVRKTEMATQYRKAYVPVTLDVDKEGAILPRLIWWDNGAIFQIDQILYKCRATSKKVGGGGIRYTVAVPTFASYSTTVKKIVAPYFREKEVTLKNLTAKDIQEFYLSELERVSPSSVIHYHANIKLCHVRHDNLRQHLLVDVMGRTGIFAARCVAVADICLVLRLFLGNLFAIVSHIPHGRSTVHTP